MRTLKNIILISLSFIIFFNNVHAFQWSEEFITIPEKTNCTQTSTHEDVMKFVNAAKTKSPLVHVETIAISLEGRAVQMLVLANPKITSPTEADASGKPVIYLQGNIHGGEVEGKEALMILMREILFGDKKDLLSNQILLITPIYNSDGNDKMAEGNRRSQAGSPKLAGSRANGQGFDLNRDGMKLEALETQGLMKNVILKWDPELFVDLHTTNGSWHGYSLTYAPSYHSAGFPSTSDYTMNTMLPEITKQMKNRFNLDMYLYGGFRIRQGWPPKTWRTYNHHPRYLVNQFGLRNKMAILSETFAHDPFYKRIHSVYAFALGIIEYTNEFGYDIMKINKEAEKAAIQSVLNDAGKTRKGVRFKMVAMDQTFTLRAYKYEPFTNSNGETSYLRKGEIVDVPGVQNFSKFEAEKGSTLPRGYLFSSSIESIAEILRQHGVKVERLQKAVRAVGEEFTVEQFDQNSRKFEGHNMAAISGTFSDKTREFTAGSYKVDLAQPLANLIFYLLEPESDDGLVAWNFFDEYLISKNVKTAKVVYPVFKYFEIEE